MHRCGDRDNETRVQWGNVTFMDDIIVDSLQQRVSWEAWSWYEMDTAAVAEALAYCDTKLAAHLTKQYVFILVYVELAKELLN